jgi:opacity protein-like surface antigen
MVSNRENCSSRKAWLRVAAAIPAAFAGFGLNIACAADLPIYAPPAPAGVNWDGIYVGLNRGIAEGRADWSNPTGFFALFPPDVPGSGAHEGVFGGVQLGYNHQFGAIVLGVEETSPSVRSTAIRIAVQLSVLAVLAIRVMRARI